MVYLAYKTNKNMFQRKIQLSESELLTLRWDKAWTSLLIKFNNTEVGSFADKSSLEAGKWVQLPNGKQLLVRLVKQELEIWDGSNELVSGLRSGESDHFANAWKALIPYGVVFLLAGISRIFTSDWVSIGVIFLTIGSFYIGLALWARKKIDKIPLYIALVLNGLLCLVSLASGGLLLIVAILGILVYYLYKGVSAKPSQKSVVEQIEVTDLLDDGI
jgi:hypothetical protein